MKYGRIAEITLNAAAAAAAVYGAGEVVGATLGGNQIADERQQAINNNDAAVQQYKQQHPGATEMPTILHDQLLHTFADTQPRLDEADGNRRQGAVIVGVGALVLFANLARSAYVRSKADHKNRSRAWDAVNHAWEEFREREALADDIIGSARDLAEDQVRFYSSATLTTACIVRFASEVVSEDNPHLKTLEGVGEVMKKRFEESRAWLDGFEQAEAQSTEGTAANQPVSPYSEQPQAPAETRGRSPAAFAPTTPTAASKPATPKKRNKKPARLVNKPR